MSRGIWSSFYRGMEPRRAKTWLMWGCSGIHHRWEGCPRQAQLRPEPWRAARMHLCWPRQQFFPTFVDFTIETSLSTSPSRLLCRHHYESVLTPPENFQRNLAVRISKGPDLCQGAFSWPKSVKMQLWQPKKKTPEGTQHRIQTAKARAKRRWQTTMDVFCTNSHLCVHEKIR